MLTLYNTLTRKKEEFKPIYRDYVGFYSCGPTVYWYAHIGNLRTYVFNDILKRSLNFLGYRVKHVMNLTDVDDKTIKGSTKEGTSLKDFTRKYEKLFFKDMSELNIIKPEFVLRATESIPEMVGLIKKLLKKGYAYKAEDGIYFSVSKFKKYGKLAGLEKVKKTKERIKSDEYDKSNAQDFALWKFYTPEDGEVFWETELGKGRPGWHIECSAMSMKILGESFDIHTGAIDLIFPHHTNEIAQSEAATGKKFVNYWVHSGFLNMKEGKMSKSLGNILTLKEIMEKGFSPLDYRYMCLTAHYRSELLFSLENLESAKNSYSRMKNIIRELKDDKKVNEKYLKEFREAVEDDLDMPKALQAVWALLRDETAVGKIQAIKRMDEVLGLRLLEKEKIKIPEHVKLMAKERWQAKQSKNFKLADELRDKINKLGFAVNDKAEDYDITKT